MSPVNARDDLDIRVSRNGIHRFALSLVTEVRTRNQDTVRLIDQWVEDGFLGGLCIAGGWGVVQFRDARDVLPTNRASSGTTPSEATFSIAAQHTTGSIQARQKASVADTQRAGGRAISA